MSATTVLPWVLSCTTVTTMWLAGNKSIWAWRLGLASQGLWAWYIVLIEGWGLLPMNAVLVGVYLRNWWKWRKP